MYLTTSLEMRTLDRLAIEKFGLPEVVLMENAAQGLARAALEHWPLRPGSKIIILAGPGQNGGDGLALARIFSGHGFSPLVFLIKEPSRIPGGAAAVNLAVVRNLGLPLMTIEDETAALPPWAEADLVVDAIFGTGLDRPLTGPAALVLAALGQAKRELKDRLRILAVDLPSGLSGDSGLWWGPPCPADLTVTLGFPKLGLYLGQGPEAAGKIMVGDIGLTPTMLESAPPLGRLSDLKEMRGLQLDRPLTGHKGSFGHVLLAGGAQGRTGALVLAAEGALRSGTGLVTVLHPASLGAIYEAKLTEAMTLELPEERPGELAAEAGDIILRYAQSRQALLLGPGLGLGNEAKAAVRWVVEAANMPLVLDADALTALDGQPELAKGRQVLMTPHPGEAARLLGSNPAEIQADRLGAARSLAERSGAVVVLKGHHSLICEPEGRFYLNPTGGSHLAVGGSGDLLAGLTAGLLAQGMPRFPAAALAAWIHGRAGDLTRAEQGPRGLTPTEFAACLPRAWAELAC
ncbi:MAG: NAD(P)H-hydrate dehydratase [Candidatus Adiutrix sp.]|jgi:NAD(P)H-hydrate epimerase|nr:NAD(P)H-hydrate dehydratase [Candidatus Adiutrix sp.]